MDIILQSILAKGPELVIAVFPLLSQTILQGRIEELMREHTRLDDDGYSRLKENLAFLAVLGSTLVGMLTLVVHLIFCLTKSAAFQDEVVTAIGVSVVLAAGLFVVFKLLNDGTGRWANPIDTPPYRKMFCEAMPMVLFLTDLLLLFRLPVNGTVGGS